ncbi:MAG TPA: N-acetyl-gamma-glutamyl-phosphate reductase [Ignavibacteriaceae bacterium]
MNNQNKINIGIIGGSGYTGKELLKILSNHPAVGKIEIYAQSTAGNSIFEIFPELKETMDDIQIKSIDDLNDSNDLYFTALPHGETLKYIPKLIYKGKKVIDIGGDYRLSTSKLYNEWYGFEHSSAELLAKKVYGLADVLDNSDYNFNLIANPGCYPTAVLIPLIPIVMNFSEKIISVSTVAYSGVSGAGKPVKADLLLSEMYGNVKAYNLNKHRHEPEINQMLQSAGLGNKPYSFSTHLLPIARGIYSTTTIHLKNELSENEVDAAIEQKYSLTPFVRIRKTPPELKWVLETNFCDINASVGPRRIILTSAIDNLIKGASGQAVQNMNRLYGLDQTAGLLSQRYSD